MDKEYITGIKAIAASILTAALTLTAAPAHAAHSHYGETSRHVAHELGCRFFRSYPGDGTVHKTGVC